VKVTSSEIEGSQVVLDMEIEAERLEQAMDRAYRRLASRVNVPGFRRGKAPRALLERMVGREALMEEALEILVPEAYHEAVHETGIDPVDTPKVDIVSAEPLSVRATVPVRPKVTMGDYRSIRQSLEVREITEAQINDAVESLRQSRGQWIPVEREAKAGDMVTLDLVARSDDDTFVDEKGANLIINPEREILAPGVVEQIIGMKATDRKAFDVTLPDDIPQKELAGHEAAVDVAVTEIKEKQLPELTDEFAQSLGDYASVDALRTAVREGLEQQARIQARHDLEESVLSAVVDQAEAVAPPVWVDEQASSIKQSTQSRLAREGLTFEQFLKIGNMTEADFNEEMQSSAKRQLKQALVLDAVAEAEGIELTDDELNAAVEQSVASRQGKVDAEEREKLKSSLRSLLRERKTIDRLVQIAEGAGDGVETAGESAAAGSSPSEVSPAEEEAAPAAESQTKEQE
jgi:trigger factor